MTNDTTTFQPTTIGAEPSNGTCPATATPPDRPTPPQPLGDFLPGGPAAAHLAVTLPDGALAVVLRRGDNGQVEVWASGRTTNWDADTRVSPVTDPDRRDGLLSAAVHGLVERHRSATEQVTRAREDLDDDRREHERVLADIRGYTVRRHQDGDICRSGLNEFLTAFGLPVFEPRIRVHYSLTGSYEVEGDDDNAARGDARGYLRPDLSELDDVLADSDTYTVRVDRVEELDT